MTITAPTMKFDCYKQYHMKGYHPDVTRVYSNFTNRSNKLSNVENSKGVVFVGLQYFIIEYLMYEWKYSFFNLDKEDVCNRHQRIMSSVLGYDVDVKYLEDLHDFGYLPLKIKALEEGTLVPYGVPCLTVTNTVEGFHWLPNYIETVLSSENWIIQTSATTAREYYKNFKKYFEQAGLDDSLVPIMGHDFSYRGLPGSQAAAMSGFGHLASGLAGTDSIPAVLFAEQYYGADVDCELVGCSVPATEHSVQCSFENNDQEYIEHCMKQTPTGILSIVSDGYDFWELVTEILPKLKDRIMERDGKIVIRPDSGDPVKILTGMDINPREYRSSNGTELSHAYKETLNLKGKYDGFQHDGRFYKFNSTGAEIVSEYEREGLIWSLWKIFGGTTTEKGYKLLDEHIGAIYGDSITLQRQKAICERLLDKGFAPTVVLGLGSFTYQYVTRDTHGSAMKATAVMKNGDWVSIHKEPKTDPGKKSLKGLLRVEEEDDILKVYDQQTEEQEQQGLLTTVFQDGKLKKRTTLKGIRQRVKEGIDKELQDG